MDNLKKRKIEWFLDFANLNLQRTALEEEIYLFQQMQNIFGVCLHPSLSSLQASIWNHVIAKAELLDKEETLKRLQGRLKRFMDELMGKFMKAQQYQRKQGNSLNPMGASEIFDLRVLSTIEIGADLRVMIKNKPKVERHPQKRHRWRAYWPDNTLKNSPLEVVITPKGGDEGFLFFFADALDGVPLTSLRRCSECNNLLLQSGKRKRLFCSDQCRVRKANRERRERIKQAGGEAYEEELQKGKERASASYERRMKGKLWSKVRVERRKTKKGKEEG